MKRRTYTAQGLLNIPYNGIAGKGESLIERESADAQLIDKGTRGVDNQPVNVKDSTFIPAQEYGIAEKVRPFVEHIQNINKKQRLAQKQSDYSSMSKRTQDIQDREIRKFMDVTIKPYEDLQKAIKSSIGGHENVAQYASGKIPWYTRAIPAIAGVGAGLSQLAHWSKEPITYHNTLVESPYSGRALQELSSLRYNPYPQIQATQDAERRNIYNINQSGGTSGAQRYLGRIKSGLSAMQNAAGVYANAEQQNNSLRQNYAAQLLAEGNAIANRRQSANQYDWADYTKAHGAKTKGIETSMANILSQINSAYSNEFKYRTWQDTADMYRQQLTNEQDRLLADIARSNADRKALVEIAEQNAKALKYPNIAYRQPWYMMPNLSFNYKIPSLNNITYHDLRNG